MKLVSALVLLSTTASSLMITAYADDEHATPALRAAAGSTNSAAASSVISSSFLEQAEDVKAKLVVKEANANADNGKGKKNGRPFGGGGGCAWPLDQFLCPQGSSLAIKIKYTVCPTADREGKVVAEYYYGGTTPYAYLNMTQYISPTAYSVGRYVVVLVDDVTVDYGSEILSATDCL